MKIQQWQRIVGEVDQLKDLFSKGRTKPYRVATKTWKHMLLNEKDTVVVDGRVRKLTAKNLGAGVYEITIVSKGV